ncbi:cytochrome P450 94A1-like [Malania oleifera]|uniref:cytochrome P450 94A1-like n=1 Tax=Malania oleifera TaxID=397392 RepID=UPI0025AE8BCA|nr:cytochrome P450 94A1-like [Malania oleifera]
MIIALGEIFLRCARQASALDGDQFMNSSVDYLERILIINISFSLSQFPSQLQLQLRSLLHISVKHPIGQRSSSLCSSAMFDLQLSTTLLLFLLPLISFLFLNLTAFLRKNSPSVPGKLPRSYPLIGSSLALSANKDRRIQWIADILMNSPSSTFLLQRSLGLRNIFTANPSNVQHILKTHFHLYQKGGFFRDTLQDFLGDGIFNADGETWKLQRQVSSHEFNTKSLRNFIENVVDAELSDRLLPILSAAAKNKTVLDFQDIFQRFAFDNVCKIAFGYDPGYLSPSLSQEKFAQAFEDATQISSDRFNSIFPLVWKLKKLFDIGSEKQLRMAINEVREFAKQVIEEKKQELREKSSLESVDLLSRFLSSGHSDENFVTEIVISFTLAGRDTTSSVLTWLFWLIFRSPEKEEKILAEIREKSEATVYEEVRDLVYTHASLCETMRLYPPVPASTKEAIADDVLPTGEVVKKGTRVTYHPYAMGRLEELWGVDWAEYKPERWLERDSIGGKWSFVGRDSYSYAVFQAGPRICLGKDMAFLQMKRVVAGVLRRFRVVPAAGEGYEPVFISYMTSKMKNGFPVRIEERADA